jgi:hypothetical protein
MALEDIPPFAKIGGIVVGLAVLGVAFKLCMTAPATDAEKACNALPMDKINPCLKRAHDCSGTEEERRACIDRAAADLK